MASGEIIAHFDDDDYYGPVYLSAMVKQLGSADFVKLSSWLLWRESDGSLWEWDTTSLEPSFSVSNNTRGAFCADPKKHPGFDYMTWQEGNIWGFGFSFVYRKSAATECPFEEINWAEDYKFVVKLRTAKKKMIHVPDSGHMVVHTLHSENSSRSSPQVRHDQTQGVAMLGKRRLAG